VSDVGTLGAKHIIRLPALDPQTIPVKPAGLSSAEKSFNDVLSTCRIAIGPSRAGARQQGE
jgi:hypothetical protein